MNGTLNIPETGKFGTGPLPCALLITGSGQQDRDETLFLGALPEPEALGADAETWAAARQARIESFREETRQQRIRIAEAAEATFGRKVAWGAECGGERVVFTTLSIPVMTRLRMKERAVLDTLVEANVARSRSEALAWCVQLVREHEGDWIKQLRDALAHVDEARAAGPEGQTS